jgi:thiamine biosynthesis lipoprotein
MLDGARRAVEVKLRVIALLLLILVGCATTEPEKLTRFEFEKPQMGVPFRIVMYAPSRELASEAAEAAFARVSQLNDIMSDYDYDSELSQLGRMSGTGQKIAVSEELWTILLKAEEFSKASKGAFDVTVGPYVQLWRRARRERQLPSADALEKARHRVGHTNMVLKDRTVELTAPDMRLDLGAIGKGFAADEALRVLKARGIKRAFTAASGDMALGDAPPGEQGWKIQLLEAQDERGQAFLILKNCGVATSGDLFQFVEIDGKRYSHIVDPRSGVGLTDRSLVTVVAKDGTTADALSTTISVMPQGEGLKLARRYGAQAREIRQLGTGGRIETTTDEFWQRAMWIK